MEDAIFNITCTPSSAMKYIVLEIGEGLSDLYCKNIQLMGCYCDCILQGHFFDGRVRAAFLDFGSRKLRYRFSELSPGASLKIRMESGCSIAATPRASNELYFPCAHFRSEMRKSNNCGCSSAFCTRLLKIADAVFLRHSGVLSSKSASRLR